MFNMYYNYNVYFLFCFLKPYYNAIKNMFCFLKKKKKELLLIEWHLRIKTIRKVWLLAKTK